MERFNSIYLFTTENIAGYMSELDLTDKKIITVTGSSDHIINAIFKGCNDITTFDINPLAKYYLDLKVAAIKNLKYKDFLDFLLFDTDKSFSYEIIKDLEMVEESKKFWLDELVKNSNDGSKLKHSDLFNLKYFDTQNKIDCNLYLNEDNYDKIKSRLEEPEIRFFGTNLKDLKINEEYDYMFLSNIADYIDTMYDKNYLDNYKKLIFKFLKKVKKVYFAYLYDINNIKKRSVIDNIDDVNKVFGSITIKRFKSAFINREKDTEDAVLIKER